MEKTSSNHVFGAALYAFALFLLMAVFATPVQAATPPAEAYKPSSQTQLAWYYRSGPRWGWGSGPRWGGGFYGPRPVYYNGWYGPRCGRSCWINRWGNRVCVRNC